MKPDAWKVLGRCVEEGLLYGVRKAYKHSDERPPDMGQVHVMVEAVMGEIAEWFQFPDPEQGETR